MTLTEEVSLLSSCPLVRDRSFYLDLTIKTDNIIHIINIILLSQTHEVGWYIHSECFLRAIVVKAVNLNFYHRVVVLYQAAREKTEPLQSH